MVLRGLAEEERQDLPMMHHLLHPPKYSNFVLLYILVYGKPEALARGSFCADTELPSLSKLFGCTASK